MKALQRHYHHYCVAAQRVAGQRQAEHRDVQYLQEACSAGECAKTGGADQYGLCCMVRHPALGDVFVSRDPTYPWP